MIRDSLEWEEAELGPWYYEMQELGFNYRISDINCALGLSQLEKLDKFKADRAKIVDFYDSQFINCPYIAPLKKLKCSDTAWHLYVVCIDFDILGQTRAEVMIKLKENGIGTQVHYIPLHKQPYYKKLYGEQSLVGAEKYYAKCLSLPLYVGMDKNSQRRVVDSLI
jgi:dTDP-4-amino-4,6-dideoxygalactose transaminase